MSFVVKVGTDPDTANPRYREFAGSTVHGPFNTREEAAAFKEEVERVWMNALSQLGVPVFVYGTPSTEVLEIRQVEAFDAARNWYLDSEGDTA